MFRGFGRRWNHTATVEPILKKSVLVETTYSHLGWLKKGAVICLGLGVALSDEGIRRSLSFWGVAFPIFLHYRFVQWKMEGKPEDEVSAAFDKLHDKYAPVAHHMCLRLRGFYLKQAQLMSTLDDFIPPAYMAWCKTTQDQVPTAFAPGQARTIVEKSLGKPLEEVFSMWNDIPRGSASIGQVHQAVLLDGREVAVKVQFPRIEEQFRSDLKTIKTFCAMALPQHVQPLEETEKQFMTEFDYALEANNLERIYANIMPTWSAKVQIPKPIMEYCTKDVLVMEYLHGIRLVDGIRNSYRHYAEKQGTTLEAIEREQKEKMKLGTFVYRSVESEKWRIRFATMITKFREYTLNSLRFIYNWSFGILQFPTLEYKWSVPLINLGEIIELLHHVHAHEIFLNGEFNGDPHPGNIMLLNDGRIGLIDYGQVKRIGLQTRIQLSKMMIAISKDDRERLIDLLWNDIGTKGKVGNKDVAYRLVCFWNDRTTKDVMGDMNIAEFLDWAQEQDPVERIHPEFVMVSRVSVLLRGMGNAFGLQLRTSDFWRVYAERVLKDNGLTYE